MITVIRIKVAKDIYIKHKYVNKTRNLIHRKIDFDLFETKEMKKKTTSGIEKDSTCMISYNFK